MKGQKLSMRDLRIIFDYRFEKKMSCEKIARVVKKSKGAIVSTMSRFKTSGLTWPFPVTLTDSDLENALYPGRTKSAITMKLPDIAYINQELKKKHVTLQRLFEEYSLENPTGLKRSNFFRFVKKHTPIDVTMRHEHRGGDTLYSDYSGDSLAVIDIQTGLIQKTQLFVTAWGASSYSYIEARFTQKQEDFVSVHKNALDYFGVAPFALVPDNLKSAVTKTDRYNPTINALFSYFCEHYGIEILPARVRKPRDKAVVESAVLHVQQFILARLRNRQFFSLDELNRALWAELLIYNSLPMKDHGNKSRHDRFIENDLGNAKKLPVIPFKMTVVKEEVKVARDYHIQFCQHFYSVPFTLAGKRVQVRQSDNVLEIYYDNQRIACHVVKVAPFKFTTKQEHMPKAHQHVSGWSPEYFLDLAREIGPSTVMVTEALLKRTDHVEHAYRSARGLLSLTKEYTPQRVENACSRALLFKNVYCGTIKTILEKSMDKEPLIIRNKEVETATIHENIRGQSFYCETTKDEMGAEKCI